MANAAIKCNIISFFPSSFLGFPFLHSLEFLLLVHAVVLLLSGGTYYRLCANLFLGWT